MEVLTTLGIIGVVAAITIPTLINGVQDIQYKSAYKKAFSTASQALAMANTEYLMVSNVSGDVDGYNNNFLAFMDQFKISKKCINSDNNQCWESTGEKFNGSPFTGSYAFIDNSGMAWTMYFASGNNASRLFFVDTNGFKKPNQWGKDRFALFMCNESPTCSAGASGSDLGLPVKVVPVRDNYNICSGNKCGTIGDKDYQTYYGTSWLYN